MICSILAVVLFWKSKIYTRHQQHSIFKGHLQITQTAACRFRSSFLPPIWAAGSTGRAAMLFRRRELGNKWVHKSRGRMCWVTAETGAQRRSLQGLIPQLDQRLPFPSDGCTVQTHCFPWSRCICCPGPREGDGWERGMGRPWASDRMVVRAEQGGAVGQLAASWVWGDIRVLNPPSCRQSWCISRGTFSTLHSSQEHGCKGSRTYCFSRHRTNLSILASLPHALLAQAVICGWLGQHKLTLRICAHSLVTMGYEWGAWNFGMTSLCHRASATPAVQDKWSYNHQSV